jgi:acetyltransferase
VHSDLKQRGLGRVLLAKMIRYLKQHGTLRMVGDVLQENTAMRALAESLGLTLDAAASGDGVLRFVLELR